MIRTTALTAVALSVAALATPAVAAPAKKPVCFQVIDPSGDGYPNLAGYAPVGPSHDSLDILSGDIATGARNMVVAIRVKTLQKDAVLAGGTTYRFAWTLGGVAQDVAYYVEYDGTQYAVFRPDTVGAGTSKLAVQAAGDPSTATITFVIPRKLNPALKPKSVITDLAVSTSIAVNQGSNSSSTGADLAKSSVRYTDGSPTCLKGV
jgi:hypothetical protein